MSSEKSPAASFSDAKDATDIAVFASGGLKTLDVALALVKDQDDETAGVLSSAESARLLRKIDWHLVPLLLLVNTGMPCRFVTCRNSTF